MLSPFTEKQLKEGLTTPWTAEQIGRLTVKYESLSKWNEIDDFYEQERQTKQAAIQKELEDKQISNPTSVDYALAALTEGFKFHINEWNIEKNQRIKPSLWWNQVVTAQQAQTESTTAPVLSKLPTDGKVWHLHPVEMSMFQARKCFCHRDFTADELTSIILRLRSLENISSEELFNDNGATRMGVNLPVRERSFSNFTTHINRIFRDFEINTCLRKIHFLAQTYVELQNGNLSVYRNTK